MSMSEQEKQVADKLLEGAIHALGSRNIGEAHLAISAYLALKQSARPSALDSGRALKEAP
jgi:hypothetical protein